MRYYLILCRSVTYAQRTARVLERAGIPARTLRAPRQVSREGCSHCVRVGRSDLDEAVERLRESGLAPKHVFAVLPDGGYQEVTHDLS